MNDEHLGSRLAALLRTLKPKTKEPVSAKALNTWIAQAEGKLGDEAEGGRLGWLIASSVAIAAVQRAIDAEGRHLFLLKGGTLLQHRLPATARTTKDVDGLIRGDLDQFILALDEAFDDPWGPLTLLRGEVEVVNVPTKLIKPRRFDIILEMRGVTWRRIQFEVSPDEAGVSEEHETIEPPPLAGFGLPDPDALVGIAMRFQIAQKLHAVSDPHEPPDSINDRAGDVVDLLLLRDLAESTGSPTLAEIRQAAMAVFAARTDEAAQLGLATRGWPPTLVAHAHWADDFARAATSGGVGLSLNEAVVLRDGHANVATVRGLAAAADRPASGEDAARLRELAQHLLVDDDFGLDIELLEEAVGAAEMAGGLLDSLARAASPHGPSEILDVVVGGHRIARGSVHWRTETVRRARANYDATTFVVTSTLPGLTPALATEMLGRVVVAATFADHPGSYWRTRFEGNGSSVAFWDADASYGIVMVDGHDEDFESLEIVWPSWVRRIDTLRGELFTRSHVAQQTG